MPKIDRIRGSINVPLDAEGVRDAEKVGEAFHRAGGVDIIVVSSLKRAQQTGQIIKKHNPEASGPLDTDALHPWHLGEYEGQPTTTVLPKIQALTRTPDKAAPGKAPNGTEEGESFNDFSRRTLDFITDLLEMLEEYPGKKIVVVTHLRVVKLLESWAEAGASKDYNIKVESMDDTKHEDPGSVFYVEVDPVKVVKEPDLNKPGLYVVRHGSTAMNGDKTSS